MPPVVSIVTFYIATLRLVSCLPGFTDLPTCASQSKTCDWKDDIYTKCPATDDHFLNPDQPYNNPPTAGVCTCPECYKVAGEQCGTNGIIYKGTCKPKDGLECIGGQCTVPPTTTPATTEPATSKTAAPSVTTAGGDTSINPSTISTEGTTKNGGDCDINPCQHGGRCRHDLEHNCYRCICPDEWHGMLCHLPSRCPIPGFGKWSYWKSAGKCLKKFDKGDQKHAIETCARYNATLPEPKNITQQQEMQEYTQGIRFWLGVTKVGGKWEYMSNNEPVTYTNWGSGMPLGWNSRDECVVVDGNRLGNSLDGGLSSLSLSASRRSGTVERTMELVKPESPRGGWFDRQCFYEDCGKYSVVCEMSI